MKIDIDEQKILKEILETDGTIHSKIKEKIQDELVDEIRDEIKSTFHKDSWRGVTDEINDRVLKDLEEQQKEMVKKILEEFYNSYRYKKDNLAILKKLKEFLGEQS